MLRLKKKAFTLIELIVVIVILGLLAALAIPTFKTVIDNARSETDKSSFASQGRAQVANAAFTQGQFDTDTVEATIRDTNGWTPTASTPTAFGEIAYSIDDASLTMVTRSSDGSLCLTSAITGNTVTVTSAEYVAASCSPTNVSTPPEETPETPEEQPTTELGVVDAASIAIAVNRESTAATFTWAAVEGAESYLVSLNGSIIATVSAPTTTLTHAVAPATLGQTLSIVAQASERPSSAATERRFSVGGAAPVVTAAISDLPTVFPEVEFEVSWPAIAEVVGYNIYVDGVFQRTTTMTSDYMIFNEGQRVTVSAMYVRYGLSAPSSSFWAVDGVLYRGE